MHDVSTRAVVALQLVACVLLFSSHHIIAVAGTGRAYSPFASGAGVSSIVGDETVYAASPHHFARTGRLHSELELYEMRNAPSGVTSIHAVPIGIVARWLGFEPTWMLLHAVGPALLWLLLFVLTRRHIPDRLRASAIAWLVLLLAFGPRNMLLIGNGSFVQPLEYMRTPNPALTLPIFIGGCALLARLLVRPSISASLVAGAVLGMQPYLYYFYGVAAVLTLLIAVALASTRAEGRALRALITASAFAAILMLPYAIWSLSHAAELHVQMARVGGFTRMPDVRGLLIFAGAVFAAWRLLPTREFSAAGALSFVACCAIAAGGAGMNVQVLTGYDAQHTHFLNRLLQPLILWVGLVWLAQRFRWRSGFAAAATLVALIACIRQWHVGQHEARHVMAHAEDYEVARWLRTNTPPDAVVATTLVDLIGLLPATAGTWNFVPHPKRSVAADSVIARRYLAALLIEGTEWEQAARRAKERPHYGSDDRLSEQRLLDLAEPLRSEFAVADPWATLAHARLDYVIVERTAQPRVELVGSPVFATPKYAIYKAGKFP